MPEKSVIFNIFLLMLAKYLFTVCLKWDWLHYGKHCQKAKGGYDPCSLLRMGETQLEHWVQFWAPPQRHAASPGKGDRHDGGGELLPCKES